MFQEISIRAKVAIIVVLAVLLPLVYFYWHTFSDYIFIATIAAWCIAIVYFIVDVIVSLIQKVRAAN